MPRPPDLSPPANHWEKHAHAWQHFGSPLRPCSEDVQWMERTLSELVPLHQRGILMGVTPELAHMTWPSGTRLVAVDQCADMIRQQWQPNPPAGAQVLNADWERMPLADSSIDCIVGDGVLGLFSFPHGMQRLMQEIHRLLHRDGRWLMRVFIRPDRPESPEQVHDALAAGEIGSFHAYKWRLAMALHPSLLEGVRPATVWQTWQTQGPDAQALAAATGWPAAQIATIDSYREAQATYYFPTLDELQQTLATHFDLLDLRLPRYELGERCPLLALRPRHP